MPQPQQEIGPDVAGRQFQLRHGVASSVTEYQHRRELVRRCGEFNSTNKFDRITGCYVECVAECRF